MGQYAPYDKMFRLVDLGSTAINLDSVAAVECIVRYKSGGERTVTPKQAAAILSRLREPENVPQDAPKEGV